MRKLLPRIGLQCARLWRFRFRNYRSQPSICTSALCTPFSFLSLLLASTKKTIMHPGNARDRRAMRHGMHRTRGKLQREKLYRLGNSVGVILLYSSQTSEPSNMCSFIYTLFKPLAENNVQKMGKQTFANADFTVNRTQ